MIKRILTTIVFCCSVYFTYAQSTNSQNWAQTDLETCIRLALENNLTLLRSRVELSRSEVDLMAANGQRIPTFNMGANTGYRWGRSINPVTNLFENNRIGNVNLFSSSNLTLFAGRQIHNSVEQAKTNIELQTYNVETTKNNITLNVVNLFINVIFAKEQLKIAQNQLISTKEQFENTAKRVDAGALPLANKLDLQAQTATNELEVINATNTLQLAKLNLIQALALPNTLTEEFDVYTPDMDAEEYVLAMTDPYQIYSISKDIMPQTKAAALGVESADYGIKVANGVFLPTLGIGGSSFSNYVDQYFMGQRDVFWTQIQNNFSYSGTIQLNIPILNNLRNKANLQRARLQKRLSEIQEFETNLQLRQDIETALTQANAAKQSYRASIIRVESLGEAFRIAQQRFDAGAINFADFQLAQNNYFNAQADLVAAKYTYIFRAKVLDFYLGNPLEL